MKNVWGVVVWVDGPFCACGPGRCVHGHSDTDGIFRCCKCGRPSLATYDFTNERWVEHAPVEAI